MEKKTKTALDDMAEKIKKQFNRMSGIVYCFSRKECETVSAFLQQQRIKAGFYHAGLF